MLATVLSVSRSFLEVKKENPGGVDSPRRGFQRGIERHS